MNKTLIAVLFLYAVVVSIALFPTGASGSLLLIIGFIFVSVLIRVNVRDLAESKFLVNLFLMALLVRVLLAVVIYGFGLEGSFGPDVFTYDAWGNEILGYWLGDNPKPTIDLARIGWGMPYIAAGIYLITGQNIFAIQIISCLLGAATSVLTYFVSKDIFSNTRVAKYTGYFVSFFPAMIIWTSQGIKEGFIIFSLVLSLLSGLRLLRKLEFIWIVAIVASLGCLFALRSYIFLMAIGAIIGGFLLSSRSMKGNFIGRLVACLAITLCFAYLGVWQSSSAQVEKYGNLDKIQHSREWASRGANSGIDTEETDVSTTDGALSALPLGIVTLLFAPFPWQIGSITQLLTLPEMLIWWFSLPFLVTGVIYTVRHRLLESISVLFFTFTLTITYSLYQGNLGTMYRQRAQIQVFLLLFIAAGAVLSLEKRENRKYVLRAKRMQQRKVITG